VAAQPRPDVRLYFNPLPSSFESSSSRKLAAGIAQRNMKTNYWKRVREERKAQSHVVRGGIRIIPRGEIRVGVAVLCGEKWE